MPTAEGKPEQLTLVMIGGDVYEASCPELRVAYYAEDPMEARKGLYRNAINKARSITEQGDEFPIRDLLPPAITFFENRPAIVKALFLKVDTTLGESVLFPPTEELK